MGVRDNNFVDPITGEKFYITDFSLSFSGGKVVYKNKNKEVIVNPKTGGVLQFIERSQGKIGVPMVSKFNPHSVSGRENLKAFFGERANKFDTKGAGGMAKEEQERKFKEQLIERRKEGKI